MHWSEIPAPLAEAGRHAGDASGRPGAARAPARRAAASRPIIRGDHSVEDYRTRLQLAAAKRAWRPGSRDTTACGRCRSRGREDTRPPLLGKPQNGFPQRPQGITQGTFLFR